MTDTEQPTIADTLLFTLTSSDTDREPVTVVDALMSIALGLNRVADAIEGKEDA
jgi:hypothetical protein